eukprot:gene33199-40967_t
MVPAKWRGDSESIIFTCKVHSDYNVRMSEMVQSNADLSRHSQLVEQENLVMKEKVTQLLARIEDLNHNMPKKIAKKMELAAKLAAEAEMNLNGKDEKAAK